MAMTTLTLDNAQVALDSTGTVTITDPGLPITIRARCDQHGYLIHLDLTATDDTHLTVGKISRLPLAHIRRIAATSTIADMVMTSIAVDKPSGTRTWGPDHWQAVRSVAAWARATKRPGGASAAVAQLWGVTRNPTAYRWIKIAERSAEPHQTG